MFIGFLLSFSRGLGSNFEVETGCMGQTSIPTRQSDNVSRDIESARYGSEKQTPRVVHYCLELRKVQRRKKSQLALLPLGRLPLVVPISTSLSRGRPRGSHAET